MKYRLNLAQMNRNFELDILRGLTIALMIIVDAPPDAIYKTLQHSAWQGLTLADTVFPAFVFAMGAATAFSISRRQPSLKKICRRAGLLFFAGILLNGLTFFCYGLEHFRFFGILQRLATVYFFGMLILLKLKSAAQISAAAFLLLIISSAGFHIYAPENPFDEMKNISGAADLIFPGVNHIYEKTHDPEGIYGNLASTATMLFGILTGKFLLKKERWKILLYGAGILILGYGWSYFDIVSKKIWTAPFALLNAGGDMILIAVLGILFEKLPRSKKFFRPFDSLGKNPLFFFLLSNVLVILMCTIEIEGVPIWILIYQKTFAGLIGVEFGALIFCVNWCALLIIPAEFLNRRGIIIKIGNSN
ncbi:MAG: DUF1624 domain-containing protein [Selenomonadaceae bacterium]|nr:DUF1624 domain-containing protein [Selenomonadaceae bacterium]